MGARGRTRRGVALVELMVAAIMLALCVVPITGTISFVRTNATQARIESQVYAGLQSKLNAQLDSGKLTTLIKSTVPTVTTQTLSGGVVVTYSLTINPVTGYTKLYALACTATWTAPNVDRTDTATLTTYAVTV